MKKGDWLLLGGCLLLGAAGLLLATLTGGAPASAGDGPLYARIQADEQTVALLPLDREADYRIATADGGENLLHVTPDSICMQSANCHNQLCVLQGAVTPDNQAQRPLGALIVCAPHRVVCELLTAAQAAELGDVPRAACVTETASPAEEALP